MQLLRTLRDSLSMTLRAYRRFDKSGGDGCYFSDMTDPRADWARNEIKGSFQKLADLYLRLGSLGVSCRYVSDHVCLYTMHETTTREANDGLSLVAYWILRRID